MNGEYRIRLAKSAFNTVGGSRKVVCTMTYTRDHTGDGLRLALVSLQKYGRIAN